MMKMCPPCENQQERGRHRHPRVVNLYDTGDQKRRGADEAKSNNDCYGSVGHVIYPVHDQHKSNHRVQQPTHNHSTFRRLFSIRVVCPRKQGLRGLRLHAVVRLRAVFDLKSSDSHFGPMELNYPARLVGSACTCSAAIIEFTIPQVVKISASTEQPLPKAMLAHRAQMGARMIAPQTAITAVQFALVKQIKHVLDAGIGPHKANLSLAYGAASVPFIACKYNLIISDVYSFNGRPSPGPASSDLSKKLAHIWRRNIAPGLLWSFIRDSGAVGGGIVMGPAVSAQLATVMGTTGEPGALLKFAGGVLSGSIGAIGTQVPTQHSTVPVALRPTATVIITFTKVCDHLAKLGPVHDQSLLLPRCSTMPH